MVCPLCARKSCHTASERLLVVVASAVSTRACCFGTSIGTAEEQLEKQEEEEKEGVVRFMTGVTHLLTLIHRSDWLLTGFALEAEFVTGSFSNRLFLLSLLI